MASKWMSDHTGTKVVCGPVPNGLEYFQGTYRGRPVEYSLYQFEYPTEVWITYLDVGESESVEAEMVLLSEIGT